MGMVLQDWLDEQQLVLTKQGDADQDNLYYVLWDTSCQCELFKGTHAEVRQAQDNEVGGAGAGFIYPCIIGYTLTSTKGRTNDTGLVLTMESKDTLNVIEERVAKIIDETI